MWMVTGVRILSEKIIAGGKRSNSEETDSGGIAAKVYGGPKELGAAKLFVREQKEREER